MANFKQNSRYTNGLATRNRSNEAFLILRRPLNLVQADGDFFLEITKEISKRPDLISSQAYNTPDLWWVIYEFNGIRDPLFDVPPGTVLRIPELSRVLDAIEEL